MKNIHVLPTDKPSRLHLWTDENGTRLETCELEYSHTRNTQHIYITSEEEIRVGDREIIDNECRKLKFTKSETRIGKKVILTTHPDLIADGVQAIDDEFLEWFVKNPSCESIKVNDLYSYTNEITEYIGYKVIIPQEEPKQETIEEAAERLAEKYGYDIEGGAVADFVDGVVRGANLQAKKMYSKEEVISFAHFYFKEEFNSTMQTSKSTDEILQEWLKKFKPKEQ
jgi:hypothetical protein